MSKKLICTEDAALTVAYNFFNPKRKKKVRNKPTDITEFLKNGGTITKLETPEYKSSHNSRYKQSDIDTNTANTSRYSQAWKDRNLK